MTVQADSQGQPGTNQGLEEVYSSIGILKSNWFNSSGKLRAYNYGTAFLISKRLLLTCSHNLCSDEMGRDADQIEFQTGIQESRPVNYYRSKDKLIIKKATESKSFKLFPLKEELCLILM